MTILSKLFSCSVFCIVVGMAKQLVDGPPNKRQKLGAPDTPTDIAGKDKLQTFSFYILMCVKFAVAFGQIILLYVLPCKEELI